MSGLHQKNCGWGISLRIIIHLENFFISPNVGMPVKPQLLVPTHFLLPKLPSELPGTTIKTQLSSSAREGTIHHIGCFPQLDASCRLASFDVNYLL